MTVNHIACNNCGRKCNINDKYCKGCSNTLLKTDYIEEQIIEGIENEELKNYIDKNSDYYLKKFAKKNNKWFIQLNFAALLFGPTWFFYRKMYKLALVYVAVLVLLSNLLSIVLPIAFESCTDEYFIAEAAYLEYLDSGRQTHYEVNGEFTLVPTYKELSDALSNAEDRISLINFAASAPVLIINVLFRLFANSFYKNHIIQNIVGNDGGTSLKSAIGGHILSTVITYGSALLICLIPSVAKFIEALSELRPYL